MRRYNPYEDQFPQPETFVTKGGSNNVESKRKQRKCIDHRAKAFEEIVNDDSHFGDHTIKVGVTIGNKVRNLRCENEWTQKELAMKLNVKVDVIRDIENGSAKKDMKLLRHLESIFNESIIT